MKQLIMGLMGLIGILLMLAGCASSQSGISLPLSDSRPTLLFFYTDN